MNGWNFSVALLYSILCLLFLSFTEDVSAGKAAKKPSTMTAADRLHLHHRLLQPQCKMAAFKLRTVIACAERASDCQKECAEQIGILDKAIGKGSESFRTRPFLGSQLEQKSSSKVKPVWLDNCMSARFHCLRQLSATTVLTAELFEDDLSRHGVSVAEMNSQHYGHNHCLCHATLKLWKVFRDNIKVVGDSKSTDCSNVEICKRLTQRLNEDPGWVCVDETIIQGLVSCRVQAKCRVEKDRQICGVCNTGAIATLECESVDWSEEAQKARAIKVSSIDNDVEVWRQFVHSQTASAQEKETSDGNLLCQGFDNIDEYRRLQLTTASSESQRQSSSHIPQLGPSILSNQFTDGIPIEEPILNLLDASSVVSEDFSDIDLSIFLIDLEPLPPSITNHRASLTSVATNGKHEGFDQGFVAGFEDDIDLDEFLPKCSRRERGESSNSAHERSMPRPDTEEPTGSRNTIASQQSRTYASVASSLNMLSAGNNLQASGQTIQLDGSWLDIYRQLGPPSYVEPMPDLASLGNFQMIEASSVGYNAEQPDFEDLNEGGDPPSLDADADNELDEFFDDFL